MRLGFATPRPRMWASPRPGRLGLAAQVFLSAAKGRIFDIQIPVLPPILRVSTSRAQIDILAEKLSDGCLLGKNPQVSQKTVYCGKINQTGNFSLDLDTSCDID